MLPRARDPWERSRSTQRLTRRGPVQPSGYRATNFSGGEDAGVQALFRSRLAKSCGRVLGGHAVALVRVLLIPFYFPPAGGGGVQRPLKLAEHLAGFGFETHVLAPTDPRWLHRDQGLAVASCVRVHRAPFVGPRGRLPAEELYGTRGFDRLAKRLALTPRRLLVPDECVTWATTAVPRAAAIVRRYRIDVVVTTSPPASVHLIGAAVRRVTHARWVADIRDALVANPNRGVERMAARLKERTQWPVAHLVAERADAVVAVTETIASEMHALGRTRAVVVIANGADFDEYEELGHQPGPRLRITHTGSFFGLRDTRPFLAALAGTEAEVVARFVGDFRRADVDWARELGLGKRLELISFVPRARALELQRDSEVLLLLLADAGGRGRDVPSGKLYEYLAARRPILAVVPPDGSAAELVHRAGAGIVVAPEDTDGIRAAITSLHRHWRLEGLPDVELPGDLRASLSRYTRNQEYAALLETIHLNGGGHG